jgi:hypothetical protein
MMPDFGGWIADERAARRAKWMGSRAEMIKRHINATPKIARDYCAVQKTFWSCSRLQRATFIKANVSRPIFNVVLECEHRFARKRITRATY